MEKKAMLKKKNRENSHFLLHSNESQKLVLLCLGPYTLNLLRLPRCLQFTINTLCAQAEAARLLFPHYIILQSMPYTLVGKSSSESVLTYFIFCPALRVKAIFTG